MLYLQDFENMGCGQPGCTHCDTEVFLHSKCHTNVPTWVRHTKGTNYLEVICAECRRSIGRIAVANKLVAPSPSEN